MKIGESHDGLLMKSEFPIRKLQLKSFVPVLVELPTLIGMET